MKVGYRYVRPAILNIEEKPHLSVGVVIACREGQEKLDLVLAALAVQSYPTSLTHVYIIDDGSPKPIKLPTIKPKNTKIINFPNEGANWGKTRATNFATSKLKEDVLWFIDADMVMHPDHLAHHMKWHHSADDYLVLGWKKFVADWDYTPAILYQRLQSGGYASLHSKFETKPSWEMIITGTDELRKPNLESFRAVVGATFSITRANWESLGGYNLDFVTGEDNELGWRALLAGLRFIPERQAESWHLGISTVEVHTQTVIAHNRPLFTNQVPSFAYLRRHDLFHWAVPENLFIIDCRTISLNSLRNLVNTYFKENTAGTHFIFVANWSVLPNRYKVTDDTYSHIRAIHRLFSGDSRIIFKEARTDSKMRINEILDLVDYRSTPYIYYLEGELDPLIKLVAFKNRIHKSGTGLEGVVDINDHRTFVVYAPALGRARQVGGDMYRNLDKYWGVRWCDVKSFDFGYTLSRKNLSPLVEMAFRSFMRIRTPGDLYRFFKRIVKVIRKTIKS